MFTVDLKNNKLDKIPKTSFEDEKLKERYDLQEWLVNTPDFSGESLLIIQKEYDGFEETNDRLDVLALDKNGRLVIIENKRDNSGKDVHMQALSYAAFLSTFSKTDVVEIYQLYLNKYCNGENAEDKLLEFFETDDIDDIDIYTDTANSRIIIIAGSFRTSVTATINDMINHGYNIQCFKTDLSKKDNILYFDIDQILPIVETDDMMVHKKEKFAEKIANAKIKQVEKNAYKEYWSNAINIITNNTPGLFNNNKNFSKHYLYQPTGILNYYSSIVLSKTKCKFEIVVETNDIEKMKTQFKALYENKDAIEQAFGDKMTWNTTNRHYKVYWEQKLDYNIFDKNTWTIADTFIENNVGKFFNAIYPYMKPTKE